MARTPHIDIMLHEKVSVLTKKDMRYEGILIGYSRDDFTVTLENVRNFGTENRNSTLRVDPDPKVYNLVVFDGNQIKDFHPARIDDPAIVSSVADNGSRSPVRSQMMRLFDTPGRNGGNSNHRGRAIDIDRMMGGGNHRHGSRQNHRNPSPRGRRNNAQHQHRGSPVKDDNRGPRHVHFRESNRQSDGRGSSSIHRHIPHFKPSGRHGERRTDGGKKSGNSRRGDGGRGRPHPGEFAKPKKPTKFAEDFDFEKAAEEFKVLSIGEKDGGDEVATGGDEKPAGKPAPITEVYNMDKSFFDNLTSVAESDLPKRSRKDEMKTNKETFGLTHLPRKRYSHRFGGGRRRTDAVRSQ